MESKRFENLRIVTIANEFFFYQVSVTESNLFNANPYNPVTKGSKYFDQRILKFLFNKDENGIMRLPLMLNTEIAHLLKRFSIECRKPKPK